ncbi:MAG TPA: hypothetical protein EYG99_01250 [Candidatus Pacebacteria bacterium]|nr:hypothetical protein [Candidatus Paceibacterota bacterium]
MIWFLFSIISVLTLAIAELMQQHLLNTRNAFSERASAVLSFIFQSLIAIPFLFLFGVEDQLFVIFESRIFFKILLVAFISSIAMIFYLKSFKVKNISISTIFISFSAVVSTVLGIIFLAESVSLEKILGIILILVAIVIIKYKSSTLEKEHLFGLAAGGIFGVAYTLDKSIVLDVHPLIYIFWTFLMIAIWGFVIGGKDVIQSVKGKEFSAYKLIIMSGFAYFLFNFFTFSAYRYGGEVGKIDAINNSQIFLIILFEYFVLKHTKGISRRVVPAVLAGIGICILGMTR